METLTGAVIGIPADASGPQDNIIRTTARDLLTSMARDRGLCLVPDSLRFVTTAKAGEVQGLELLHPDQYVTLWDAEAVPLT